MGSRVEYRCQRCLSVWDREKEIKTGDGQISKTRKRETMWKVHVLNNGEYLTFLNVTFGIIPDSVDQMLAGMIVETSLSAIILI